mgnify:CR=1 FL=1
MALGTPVAGAFAYSVSLGTTVAPAYPAGITATDVLVLVVGQRLLDVGADLAKDPHFGLHVGERFKLGTYSVYGLILLSCRDFGQAFEQTMRRLGAALRLPGTATALEIGMEVALRLAAVRERSPVEQASSTIGEQLTAAGFGHLDPAKRGEKGTRS